MSDPLSLIPVVVGLVASSLHLARRAKEICNCAKIAPASMLQIQQEIELLHPIFRHVEALVRGTAKKTPNRKGLAMISVQDLMTILTGCVLVFSEIDKKLCHVAGLVDPITQKPARNLQCMVGRIKWVLWKETEVVALL